MESLTPTELKSILHSKRANIYYLEHCRVLSNGGRVEYVTEQGKQSLYWNIPIANTTCILLGTGTSITQSAMRDLAKAGVLVGFSGGGGTPLFSANEIDVEFSWLTPQSEYRPTEYLQNWVSFWFDDNKRLLAAIEFQKIRIFQIKKHWLNSRLQRESKFDINDSQFNLILDKFLKSLEQCRSSNDVLSQEALLAKSLYKLASTSVGYGTFVRSKRGEGFDLANKFLDYGNYLAYGLAATAAWVIGLPHGLAVLHGKTRRGGLVFDIADLVKDALVLPNAFIAAMNGDTFQEFRNRCIVAFNSAEALDVMIDATKYTAEKLGSK